jgi:pyruvate/2-oxoglutarate dehydrogenase complex dihydrolipoamide acyltransferase (E2) component
MEIKALTAAMLLLGGMAVAPAIAEAQTSPKVVATPTPSGQMVTPDQAHQENKAPPLSELRAKRAAEMGTGPQSAVRTPTPNGEMIHKDGTNTKPQN